MKFILRLIPIAIIIVLFFRISELALNLPTQMFNAASKHAPSGAPVIQLNNHAPNFIEFTKRLIDGQPLVTSETKTTPETLAPTQQQLFVEQIKKDEKFRAYYHKPEKCDPPSTHEIRVACVNENMRARTKFEALYSQGKI
ncbi:MAG: hypothetical protein NTW85_15090 [Methylococcales bacterium]|nr:hypothetical protein [Methylococcales bacterium]